MQESHSNCSRVAQHVLILGSSDHVKLDPRVSQPNQLANSAFQPDSLQEFVKPKSTSLASRLRASAIKAQGFSELVAA